MPTPRIRIDPAVLPEDLSPAERFQRILQKVVTTTPAEIAGRMDERPLAKSGEVKQKPGPEKGTVPAHKLRRDTPETFTSD